jgi:hypothetical protein
VSTSTNIRKRLASEILYPEISWANFNTYYHALEKDIKSFDFNVIPF